MKRLLFLSFIGLFAQFLVSCYPGGADNVEEMDVAITNYDRNADFTKYTTFSLPDTIVISWQKEKLRTTNSTHKFYNW